MRQFLTYGSVRRAAHKGRSYRNPSRCRPDLRGKPWPLGVRPPFPRCLAFTVRKRDRHRRQTENSRKTQSATEPVPIFGLPAHRLSY